MLLKVVLFTISQFSSVSAENCIVKFFKAILVVAEDIVHHNHRRRIELEDEAKVVASDWGTESLTR